MNITYQENDGLLIIKDDLQTYYMAVKLILILNIVTGLLNMASAYLTEWSFLTSFWLVMVVITSCILYVLFMKRTTASHIPIADIRKLTVINLWVTKKHAIQLENGRLRSLPDVKTNDDVALLESFIAQRSS